MVTLWASSFSRVHIFPGGLPTENVINFLQFREALAANFPGNVVHVRTRTAGKAKTLRTFFYSKQISACGAEHEHLRKNQKLRTYSMDLSQRFRKCYHLNTNRGKGDSVLKYVCTLRNRLHFARQLPPNFDNVV